VGDCHWRRSGTAWWAPGWGSEAGATAHDQKQLAKLNARLVAEQNAKNQAWAEHILDISHPQMSGQDLGNLLFQQGEGEATRQHDIDLATTLRQNLRSGSPLSTTDIMGGFDRQNAGQWQDKLAEARLKGMLGVLPGASALNIAGSVGKGEAPQMSGISEAATEHGQQRWVQHSRIPGAEPPSTVWRLWEAGSEHDSHSSADSSKVRHDANHG
jgi:hypothetical protein